MTINLNVRADVIDIKTDTPQQADIFLVDTNVWFLQTYTNASASSRSAPQRTLEYTRYLATARNSGATLAYSGLILSELANAIERTEFEIFKQRSKNPQLNKKEYRHNYPAERMKVVSEVQSAWSQVKSIAVPVNLKIDDETTDASLARFQAQALDAYDLMLLEAINRAEVGQVKVLTDDLDYAVVPDIQVFTRNYQAIQLATAQKKLVSR